jgi:hypothetical protein
MYGASPDVIATGNADVRLSVAPCTTIAATNEGLIGGLFATEFPHRFPRVPGTAFNIANELAFDLDVTLNEGQNSIVVYARMPRGTAAPSP